MIQVLSLIGLGVAAWNVIHSSQYEPEFDDLSAAILKAQNDHNSDQKFVDSLDVLDRTSGLKEWIEGSGLKGTQLFILPCHRVTVYRQPRAARDFVGAFLCRDMAATFRSYFSPHISR